MAGMFSLKKSTISFRSPKEERTIKGISRVYAEAVTKRPITDAATDKGSPISQKELPLSQ
jgi:hypothetical protein